jgi:phospholipase C
MMIMRSSRRSASSRARLAGILAIALGAALLLAGTRAVSAPAGPAPRTPIKHLVVIFQENHSFDVYFATYPVAANPPGEPGFCARADTPSVNGLTPTLIERNPNSSMPFRIDRLQSYTCDQDHEYTDEQRARNGGLMDQYPRFGAQPPTNARQFCHKSVTGEWDTVMGYFDGNTVTAYWNYAQHFALSDNSFATMSGQSTRGALNLTAGDTYGVVCGPKSSVFGDVPECGTPATSTSTRPPTNGNLGTFVDDTDPFWDVCSQASPAAMTGRNIGDLLTAANVTWGWFQGGFTRAADGTCSQSHPLEAFDRAVGVNPATDPLRFPDYVPHHNPFQYFASTANPLHLPPTSVAMVGKTDQANHLYDLSWFWDAARAGNLPAVSFLKAPAYQNGHPGNSNPLDEQTFIVNTLKRLQQLPEWKSMAVIIAADDSDGWYDHVMPPIVNQSNTPLDFLCGSRTDGPGARCGYGPRLPLLVISPYAKENYVSHVLTDQTSILRFIEDNWLGGQRISQISFDRFAGSLDDMIDFDRPKTRRLLLDPVTGLPLKGHGHGHQTSCAKADKSPTRRSSTEVGAPAGSSGGNWLATLWTSPFRSFVHRRAS